MVGSWDPKELLKPKPSGPQTVTLFGNRFCGIDQVQRSSLALTQEDWCPDEDGPLGAGRRRRDASVATGSNVAEKQGTAQSHQELGGEGSLPCSPGGSAALPDTWVLDFGPCERLLL